VPGFPGHDPGHGPSQPPVTECYRSPGAARRRRDIAMIAASLAIRAALSLNLVQLFV
jgi:hypothetical protein